MNRSITITDGRPFIRTTNGVDTRSAPVYLKELKDYQPSEGGFVTELAQDVQSVISEHPSLWDQGVWRVTMSQISQENDPDLYAELQAMRSTPLDPDRNACGTTMCMAGWAAELSGVDWMVDADRLGKVYNNEEYALVTEEQWNATEPCDSGAPSRLGQYDTVLNGPLKKRGFTDEHLVVRVGDYACAALGLIHGDWLELFNGSNDLQDLRLIVQAYAEFGVVPNLEAMEHVDSHDFRQARKSGQDPMVTLRYHLTDCRRALANA
jgi:hypothetical protein